MLRISCTGSRPVSHATSTSRVSLVPHFVFRSSPAPDACAPWSQCHHWAKRRMSSVSSVRWWRRLRRRSWSRVHWAAMKQLLWMWHFPRLIWGNFAKQSSQTLPRVNFAVWRTASGQLWDRGRPMIHCRMPSVGTWHATSFLPALGAAFLPAMRCCCLPTGPSRAKLGCEPMPPRPWRCPALLKLQRHGGANPRWSWRKWRLKLCYGLGKLTFGRSATLRPFLSFLRLAISSAATRTGMGCLGLRTIEIGMPEDGFFSRGTKRKEGNLFFFFLGGFFFSSSPGGFCGSWWLLVASAAPGGSWWLLRLLVAPLWLIYHLSINLSVKHVVHLSISIYIYLYLYLYLHLWLYLYIYICI